MTQDTRRYWLLGVAATAQIISLAAASAQPVAAVSGAWGRSPGSPKADQSHRIEVGKDGFKPSTVKVLAGTTVKLTFVRTTDETCAKEVAIPALKITKAMPLNTPVTIEFKPAKTGQMTFACGMSMLKGTIVVE